MTDELESALRQLVKTIVEEVVVHRDRQIPERSHSPQATASDDVFLLTSRETAKRLAISEKHLSKLTRSGILPCVRVGHCVRYSVEAIQKYIRESESTAPLPRAKKMTIIKTQAAPAAESKPTTKPAPKLSPKRVSAKKAAPAAEMKAKKKPDPAVRSAPKKTESEERQSPFSALLKELGVNRSSLPPITNGELRQIAEVDIPTLHGWLYLNRQLPEAALNKLRKHFGAKPVETNQ